jgi:hypothetical protein
MIAYWLMFAMATVACLAVNVQQSEPATVPRLPALAVLLPAIVALACFAGVRDPHSDADYFNYIDWFDIVAPSLTWTELFSKDPVFQLLGLSLRTSSGSLLFLMLLIALASLTIKIRVLQSSDYHGLIGFALLFLISRFFIIHEFTQVRAALGISLATLALVQWVEGKMLRGIAIFVLAALTHISVVALLPLVFVSRQVKRGTKVALVGTASLVAIVMMVQFSDEDRFGFVLRIAPYLTGQYEVSENTLLSVYFLVKAVTVVVLLAQWRHLNQGMRLATAASAYGLLLTILFLRVNVFSLRLSELVSIFDCICLSWVFSRWCARQPVFATVGALALAGIFYFSALKIVNDYQVLF